jgi:transposase InsO family protein
MKFGEFCDELGIRHYLTAPYSPQQNGVVERRNQTAVGMARSLLKSKEFSGVFWGMATTIYLLNRAPTKQLP